MGVITVEQEISCSLPPSRLFKSFVLDPANLFPKILPNFFKSFETVEGHIGRVGSITLVTFSAEGLKPSKHKIEEVDEEKHTFKYTLYEGGLLGDEFESITYFYKFEAHDGGSKIKIVETYHPKVDEHHTIQEKIDHAKEATKGLISSLEAHLHAHPNEYI